MIIKTNEKGYNYKYTDLAGIHKTLEDLGLSYQQETRTEANGDDYIYTKVFDKDGKVTIDWTRGAKIVQAFLSGKTNPAQEYGSALTYARRYSLYMTLGIATEDDDAKSLDGAKEVPKFQKLKPTTEPKKEDVKEELITKVQNDEILKLLAETESDVLKDIANFGGKTNVAQLTNKEADQYIKVLQKRKDSKKVE